MADDLELWTRIREGDAIAFDGFYREQAPRLLAFLRQTIGNRQAAEDVTQETFAQIWSRPHGFEPERGTLSGYLHGIGRNKAAEWWRRQRPSEPAAGEKTEVCQTEISSIVNDAFQRLPKEQRELLWLREVEGRSYGELATILEIPVGTVRSRLFAAREALRQIWRGGKGNSKEAV